MRPKTSVRQPIIAATRPRHLSDLLRTWRRQPRKRSPLLFWTLLLLAVAMDTALLFLAARFLGLSETTSIPPAERRMYVRFALDADLWEPLRSWVIRVNGRTTLFESFCRRAVRDITGAERFEDRDPLAVVVSWMLENGSDAVKWDDYPFVRCEDAELRAALYDDGRSPSRLSRAEQLHGRYVEPVVADSSRRFRAILHGFAVKNAAGGSFRPSPLERQAVELRDRLALFHRIRRGAIDDNGGAEMRTASAELREAYRSDENDLFAAALNDFLEATRRVRRGDDEATTSRRLACESWLNRYAPVRQALYGSVLAAGLFAAASIVGRRRPSWRRGLLLVALLAGAGCLGWSVAALVCRTLRDDAPPLRNGTDLFLLASTVVLGLSLVLARLRRDAFVALSGTLVSSLGFFLANREASSFAVPWSAPSVAVAWDGGLCIQIALLASAYAVLALAWGVAALTLGRILLAFLNGERLRGLATHCVGSIRVALALLAASALLDALRALMLGASWRGWNAQAVGTLLALPGCVALLHARRNGRIAPFALLMAVVIGCAFLAMMGYITAAMGTENQSLKRILLVDPWLCGACLISLSLALHAALRYYFGRQRILDI
jgi:hypothetical protein